MDTDYYFKIHTFNSGTQYVISYCGTGGGYTNCTVEDSSQSVIADPEGEVAIEGHYSCAVHHFGNSSDQLNIGTTDSHVQGLTDDGQWIARSWGNQGSDCSDWNNSQNNGGETMRFYDTRNAN